MTPTTPRPTGTTLLRGDRVRLRPVQTRDLDELYDQLTSLDHRGAYYPAGLQAEPVFRRRFEETGFWSRTEGMLLVLDVHDDVVGEIEFFPIADYLTGFELSYLLFGVQHHGRGYTTDAVRLLTRYLFAQHRVERLQLAIHPDNAPSRRVAEKTGFTLEGVMRRCWFHDGDYHDLELWSILRDEQPPP